MIQHHSDYDIALMLLRVFGFPADDTHAQNLVSISRRLKRNGRGLTYDLYAGRRSREEVAQAAHSDADAWTRRLHAERPDRAR